VDVGVDDDLVLALVYIDVHLVYNLTYINSISSPALCRLDRKYFLTKYFFKLVITLCDHF
jgi:hypothetical protein